MEGLKWKRILIANRGEIAHRIGRTAKRLGLETVGIYSDSDATSLHVSTCDIAIGLGPHPQRYCDIELLVEIAKEQHCDAVAPGYGFLSEVPKAAQAFTDSGIVWIGPSADLIELFGLKHTFRQASLKNGIPVVPGSHVLASKEEAIAAGDSIGYPCLLKATAGGGGKGQQLVATREGMGSAFEKASAQAQVLYNDSRLYVEKYVPHARHIEVQVFGFGDGNIVALGERDCTVQRRRQKVIEETPAPNLPDEIRQQITEAAIILCRKYEYESAGTVEFLVGVPEEYTSGTRTCDFEYFILEVNTRIQVEHGVTEMTYNVDLIEMMILHACGIDVRDRLNSCAPIGHSIQARLYAENPYRSYEPCTGTITELKWPHVKSGSIRIDSALTVGSSITSEFDPMIGKILVHAPTRSEAIELLIHALNQTRVRGLMTNYQLLKEILNYPSFVSGLYITSLLETMRPHPPNAIECLSSGLMTSIQDYPGRVGFWHVGVSPSGAMDSYAMCLANQLVGNSATHSALEITLRGPSLKFHTECRIAFTGARLEVLDDEDRPIPWWTSVVIKAGRTLTIEDGIEGLEETKRGKFSYLAVKGGFDLPLYMGSTSTFAPGSFGGLSGSNLKAGDYIPLGPAHQNTEGAFDLNPGLIPQYRRRWIVGAVIGPHGSTDLLRQSSLDLIWSTDFTVDRSSNRMGVRLSSVPFVWSRPDGGGAGLHPSNVHDYTYTVGAVNFSGNTPVILMVDGPSLGGFACPITVPSCELWKVAQALPGDIITFKQVTRESALAKVLQQRRLLTQCDDVSTYDLEWVLAEPSTSEKAIIQQFNDVTYRLSGTDHILVEYGMGSELDLCDRFRVQLILDRLSSFPYITELCPGVRSLLVGYDTSTTALGTVMTLLLSLEGELSGDTLRSMSVPSRVLRLPLAFDDKWNRDALIRYSRNVREKAPYLPSNVEFIRRINGLEATENVQEIMNQAQYLVLGLGDVYLGAPCAIALDPKHRLVTTKFNPARTFTPEGAVGLGGSYLCIYGMDSPGGYILCGRTLPIWDSYGAVSSQSRGRPSTVPWLLNTFDRIQFYQVSDEELEKLRLQYRQNAYKIDIKEETLSFQELEQIRETAKENEETQSFLECRRKAFEEERERWLTGEGEDKSANESNSMSHTGSLNSLRSETPSVEADLPVLSTDDSSTKFSVDVRAGVSALVWKVCANQGDIVKEGDNILILESMKMEIEITAPTSGILSALHVDIGQKVESETLICCLELTKDQALGDLSIPHLRKMYRSRVLTPWKLVQTLLALCNESKGRDESVFISLNEGSKLLGRCQQIQKQRYEQYQPLYGIPFVVKDNIDVQGLPTTCACPGYAYEPTHSAEVVQLLEKAGGICLGKTNMDCFATGLVGTRSAYGIPRNPHNPLIIPGGSSSGSAVAVARRLASFSLGTDTAGSGRVPAALNGLVGLKPSKGIVSCHGVVPACKSLDCVSVFALTSCDAKSIFDVIRAPSEVDPYSRLLTQQITPPLCRFGCPETDDLEFFGDEQAQLLYHEAINKIASVSTSWSIEKINFKPFKKVADLLYGGPFVAERFSAVGSFVKNAKADDQIDATVAEIIKKSEKLSAFQLFYALHELEQYRSIVEKDCWAKIDVLVVPTIPTVFTTEQVMNDPLSPNNKLGYYTNFVNLLDLCALAIPVGGIRSDNIPNGITLIAPRGRDQALLACAEKIEAIQL